MIYAVNVTGIRMLALGEIATQHIYAIIGSAGNVAGYDEDEVLAVLTKGGKIHLEGSGCQMVVDVWRNCVGQLANDHVIEIYATLLHCAASGSEWEFHVFKDKHELSEIKDAGVLTLHEVDAIDEDIELLQKQIEALHVKRTSAFNNFVRLGKMTAARETAK